MSKVRDGFPMYVYCTWDTPLRASVDKELWFDFGPPKKLRKDEFQKQFGHLKLDSVLQYVAFPQIELIEDDDGPTTRRKTRTVGFNIAILPSSKLTLLGLDILFQLVKTERSETHC